MELTTNKLILIILIFIALMILIIIILALAFPEKVSMETINATKIYMNISP